MSQSESGLPHEPDAGKHLVRILAIGSKNGIFSESWHLGALGIISPHIFIRLKGKRLRHNSYRNLGRGTSS
jgi:hypothetical protein